MKAKRRTRKYESDTSYTSEQTSSTSDYSDSEPEIDSESLDEDQSRRVVGRKASSIESNTRRRQRKKLRRIIPPKDSDEEGSQEDHEEENREMEMTKKFKKATKYVSSSDECQRESLTQQYKKRVARYRPRISVRRHSIVISSDDEVEINKPKRSKKQRIESSEEDVEKDNCENNNIDQDEDEIICIGELPPGKSTIVRSNYRVKVTSNTSSNTESSAESLSSEDEMNIDLNDEGEEHMMGDAHDLVESLSGISPLTVPDPVGADHTYDRSANLTNQPVTSNPNQVDSVPTPRASVATPFQSLTTNPSERLISSDINDDLSDSMDISDILSDGEILSGDEVLDSYDLPETPNISVNLSLDGQNKNCDRNNNNDKNQVSDKQSEPKDKPSDQPPEDPIQVITRSPEPQPCPESELISEPSTPQRLPSESAETVAHLAAPPRLPLPPPEPDPPQPQLPSSSIPFVAKTPTYYNRLPYKVIQHKNGQPIEIPPPPALKPLITIHVLPAQLTIDAIKRRLNNNSDEIEAIDQTLKVSLSCPISGKRVFGPCRSIKCSHFDCFSGEDFFNINYNKKIDDWKCPKCGQPARLELLVLDGLMDHILKHPAVDSSVESVTFDNKAIWRPDIRTVERAVMRSNDNNAISIDDTVEDIIELDDDDDGDDEPTPPTTSAPSMPTARTLLVIPKSQNNSPVDANHVRTTQTNANSTTVNGNGVSRADPRLRRQITAPPQSNATTNQNRSHPSQQTITQPIRTNISGVVLPLSNTNGPPRTTSANNPSMTRSQNQIVNHSRLPSQVAQAIGVNNVNDASFEFGSDGQMRGVYCNLCKLTLNVQNRQQIWSHFTDHLKSPQTRPNPSNAANAQQNTRQNSQQLNANQSRTNVSSISVPQSSVVNNSAAPIRSTYNANNNYNNIRNYSHFMNGYNQYNSQYQQPLNQISNNIQYLPMPSNFTPVGSSVQPMPMRYMPPVMPQQMPYPNNNINYYNNPNNRFRN